MAKRTRSGTTTAVVLLGGIYLLATAYKKFSEGT